MGHRREPRVNFVVPVTLFMLDDLGQPIVERTCTLNASWQGLSLSAKCLHKKGQEVVVAFSSKKARFRVAWIGAKGTPAEGVAGLVNLEPDKALFGDLARSPYQVDNFVDNYIHGTAPLRRAWPSAVPQSNREGERRKAQRYPCEFSAEIRVPESGLRTWARVTDISTAGCYLAITSFLQREQLLRLRLFFDGSELKTAAVVKSTHPGTGAGLAFRDMAPEERKKLEDAVARLANAALVRIPADAPRHTSAPALEKVSDPLARWFETHDLLTRAQYLELIGRTPCAVPTALQRNQSNL